VVRESLIEHVGSLPVVATTIYPYLKDDDIDLGEALVMLAIHDIGELVTGDKITFAKNDDEEEIEQAAAIKLLSPAYHDLYNRIEHAKEGDKTAQFAKSIDKITPDFFDYLTPPEITMKRYKDYMDTDTPEQIIQLKIDHKLSKMTWDPTLHALFEFLLDKNLKKLK